MGVLQSIGAVVVVGRDGANVPPETGDVCVVVDEVYVAAIDGASIAGLKEGAGEGRFPEPELATIVVQPASSTLRRTPPQWAVASVPTSMTYTALAVLFLVLCIAVGALAPGARQARVAVLLALMMVAAQFAFLMWSS